MMWHAAESPLLVSVAQSFGQRTTIGMQVPECKHSHHYGRKTHIGVIPEGTIQALQRPRCIKLQGRAQTVTVIRDNFYRDKL